jgi:hypothetical protein
MARKLFMNYFQTWHRFFPFLHGPTVSKDLESLYATDADGGSCTPATRPTSTGESVLPLARVIILQCLFNLAGIHGGVELPVVSRINKPTQLLPCLLGFAAKGDIISIQALFAAQMLLVARMSLRTAVVVGGLRCRAIFLAGLHRCPVRYAELSPDDCDIRKRLFWSIYVVDRFLSQALGHPLGIQDSDIDVCSLAGPEHHSRHFVPQDPPPDATTARRSSSQPRASPNTKEGEEVASSVTTSLCPRPGRNQILTFHVGYYRLSGRALELFHKSIHIRSIDPGTVLALRTDLDTWWNSLPSELQDFNASPAGAKGQDFRTPSLFILLHSQLRLLIHRSWLSLEPSAAEFQSALQVCVGVSRDIILGMRQQHNAKFALFWPGYLSAT